MNWTVRVVVVVELVVEQVVVVVWHALNSEDSPDDVYVHKLVRVSTLGRLVYILQKVCKVPVRCHKIRWSLHRYELVAFADMHRH